MMSEKILSPEKEGNRRWIIVALIFVASVLNYIDKNTLSILAPTIQKDLSLSDQDYANIQNIFQVAYTVGLIGSGVIVDRYGPRLSLSLFVGWWSVANLLTGFARSFTSLACFRFLLGLGEAGNWTAGPKAVAEWFPPKERGLAIGIYTAGTPIGMTLAPIIIIGLSAAWGWQAAFVVTGIVGIFWLIPWLYFYRTNNPEVREEGSPGVSESSSWTWREALSHPVIWVLMVGRMFSDPVWYFYQNWYPKYLVEVRGLTQIEVRMTWVIFMAAGLGSVCGGWFAGRWIKNGAHPEKTRLFIMLGCAGLMPLSLGVGSISSVQGSLMLASIIVFAHLAWLINLSALTVDIIPQASLGKVFGIIAAGSSVGAIAMNYQVGQWLKPDALTGVVAQNAYSQWYQVAGFLHLLVIPLLWRMVIKSTQGKGKL